MLIKHLCLLWLSVGLAVGIRIRTAEYKVELPVLDLSDVYTHIMGALKGASIRFHLSDEKEEDDEEDNNYYYHPPPPWSYPPIPDYPVPPIPKPTRYPHSTHRPHTTHPTLNPTEPTQNPTEPTVNPTEPITMTTQETRLSLRNTQTTPIPRMTPKSRLKTYLIVPRRSGLFRKRINEEILSSAYSHH